MSEENEDLQSFFDNFHKEIEDGSSTVVTLTAENLATVAGGDKVVQKILLEGVDVSDDEDVTYFLDNDGNCFKQSKSKLKNMAKSVTPGRPVRRAAAVKANANIAKSKPQPPTIKTENPEYIVRLDGYISDEQDESSDNKSKVYNFEETAEGDDVDIGEEFGVSSKMIRLKPMAAASPMLCCNLCNYKTNKKFLLQRHEKTHSLEKPFKCPVCERGFKTNAALVNHVNSHNGHKPHACKSCESAFTTSGELIRHVRYKHTGEKPHKCTECGYASVEMSKLRRHIRCHTGERPYQCPHCTYASPDTFKLKRHLRTHTGEKPYECDICKARFSQSNSLKSHRLIHSVVDKPVFQCSMCPTTCGRKSDLRLHVLNLHQSDNPIPCKRCGMKLKDRYSYKLHIKSHEGEKCYRCSLCPYASVSQRHLDSHMLIHTDEKPFKCDFCELEFRQRQLLRRHVNIYHVKDYVPPQPRNKVHVCPHCKRNFTHKGNLMRHMEVHDPTLKVMESKLELRKGRSVRVNENQPENDICIEDETLSDGEIIEFTEDNVPEEPEEVIVQTPKPTPTTTKVRSRNNQQTAKNNTSAKDVITFRIKQEPHNQELITVNVEGEEQYMVLEVVNDAEDDDDDDQNLETDLSKIKVSKTKVTHTKISPDNCFGFEVDDEEGSYEEEDYNEDVENKEFIQLMDILQ